MESLLLPERVVLRLVDPEGEPLRVANVLFTIHTFAKSKNDFRLGPFASDADGIVTITKRDLLAEAEAHYDSGLMDYDAVQNCQTVVEIEAMEASGIAKALEARTKIWKRLLRGESERWSSIEDLLNIYRTAANERISVHPIAVRWDGSEMNYEYIVRASPLGF